jgi:hypothetical protein
MSFTFTLGVGLEEFNPRGAVLPEAFSSIWIDGRTIRKVHPLCLKKTSILGTDTGKKG